MKRKIFSLISILSIIISVYVVYPNNVNADSEIISGGKISGDFEMKIDTEQKAIWLNGNYIATDMPPQVINNDFMLPLRAAFECIGAYVDFNSEAKTVTVTFDGDTLMLNFNSDSALLNGKKITLSAPVLIVNERTLIPAKAVMSVLGFDTTTDESNTMLTITYSSDCSYSISSNGVLEISGNGKISKFNYNSYYPWDAYKDIITEINVSEGITHIPDSMFADCTNAETLFLPASIKYIGRNVTSNSLMDVYYNDSHSNWSNINNLTEFEQFALIHYTDNYTEYTSENSFDFYGGVVTNYTGNEKIVRIPPTINGNKVIAIEGFKGKHIEQVVIPYGVKTINEYSFSYCDNLKRVIIPKSVNNIGACAFLRSGSLRSVEIPDGITTISNETFEYCYNLQTIILPDTLTTIGHSAFSSCSNLTEIDLPNSITTINYNAFANCSHLVEMNLPENLTTLDDGVFQGCHRLKYVSIPNSVVHIGNYSFMECEELQSIIIPLGVESIGFSAFCGCRNLNTIILPNNIISLGKEAFSGCVSLSEIAIPNIMRIDSNTFYGCYGLTKITIPNTVALVENNAFNKCYSLSSIYYEGTESEWDKIDIKSGNDCILTSTINYNYPSNTQYVIYYYMNDESSNVQCESFDTGKTGAISSTIPTRNGYKFIGWSTSKYATVPEYHAGDEYTSNESISLYAIWEAIPQIINNLQEYSDYTIATVSVDKLKEPCTLCVAQYIDDILLKTETRSYNDGNELFLISDNADKFKILAWDDLNNMVPICNSITVHICNSK